jgi:hypothetical protein
VNTFMGLSKFVRYGLVTLIGIVFLPIQAAVEWFVVCMLDEEDNPRRKEK